MWKSYFLVLPIVVNCIEVNFFVEFVNNTEITNSPKLYFSGQIKQIGFLFAFELIATAIPRGFLMFSLQLLE